MTGSKDKVANAASVSATSEPKLQVVEAWVDEHADYLFRYALIFIKYNKKIINLLITI